MRRIAASKANFGSQYWKRFSAYKASKSRYRLKIVSGDQRPNRRLREHLLHFIDDARGRHGGLRAGDEVLHDDFGIFGTEDDGEAGFAVFGGLELLADFLRAEGVIDTHTGGAESRITSPFGMQAIHFIE
jgi:hypothetical protein